MLLVVTELIHPQHVTTLCRCDWGISAIEEGRLDNVRLKNNLSKCVLCVSVCLAVSRLQLYPDGLRAECTKLTDTQIFTRSVRAGGTQWFDTKALIHTLTITDSSQHPAQ